jgi:hypothetical protein
VQRLGPIFVVDGEIAIRATAAKDERAMVRTDSQSGVPVTGSQGEIAGYDDIAVTPFNKQGALLRTTGASKELDISIVGPAANEQARCLLPGAIGGRQFHRILSPHLILGYPDICTARPTIQSQRGCGAYRANTHFVSRQGKGAGVSLLIFYRLRCCTKCLINL